MRLLWPLVGEKNIISVKVRRERLGDDASLSTWFRHNVLRYTSCLTTGQQATGSVDRRAWSFNRLMYTVASV